MDYIGPFLMKEWSKSTTKAYLCVFVYLAVHLEMTRDLIMESFLNCLSRIVGVDVERFVRIMGPTSWARVMS